MAKVVCAMSGGVDSSVAAALLLEQGHEILGVFMRLGSPRGVAPPDACEPDGNARGKQGCCSVLDSADARRVAGMLGIPFYVLNFEDDFSRVIDYFTAEYNSGRTPNPCVRCNDWLKFGKLAQYARAVGADFVASGHYARIADDPATGQPRLLRGIDHSKDQSYVLFGIPPDSLRRTLLPIGGFQKPEVRQMAEQRGLPVFNKPDSQEICFVPDQDYAAVVRRRSPEAFRPGRFLTSDGAVVGSHEGHQQFTIGQRKGLNLALGRRIFVVGIDPASGAVTVGPRQQLLKSVLHASQSNWLVPAARDADSLPVQARIRYNHDPAPARLTTTGPRSFRLDFDTPQTAITPGQAVVCYDHDTVLGGGWIDRAE